MMKRNWVLILSLCFSLSAVQAKAPTVNDVELMCLSYMRLLLSQQIPKQAASMVEASGADVVKEVSANATRWMKQRVKEIRSSLDDYFGDAARAKFERFVSSFTSAEGQNDTAFLSQLSQDLNLGDPVPASYQDLRLKLIGERLQADIGAGSEFLGEVQTWVELKEEREDVPSLFAWLTRDEEPAAARQARGPSGGGGDQVGRDVDPFEEAEGEFEMLELDEDDFSSPLDAYDSGRKEKRDRKLAEAQAGMQQVAQERQAAEEEYAQRKLAAAQADAEAMRRHAEELAAVEQQALEQRQRSWGNRLKSIVGTAAGSFGGAFLGGIGEKAAQEAINQVWQ